MKSWILGGIAALALSATLLISGCGTTRDPVGDAYKATQSFTGALHERNFGTACTYYSKEVLGKPFTYAGVKYTANQACAITFVQNEGLSLVIFGQPVFDKFNVNPVPVINKKYSAPKNGYVFKVKFSQGTVYVGVQRDNEGTWRIVSIRG